LRGKGDSSMMTSKLPLRTWLVLTAASVIGLFAIIYVSWFLYAVYVISPREYARNDANYSLSGILFMSGMVVLAASTVLMSRSVWLSSYGRQTSTWKLRIYTGFMMIFSVLISPVYPTTLIFFLFALVLQFLLAVSKRTEAQVLEN